MQIQLENIGRRFNKEWIFKDIHFLFNMQHSYALLGPNGSGKSTLLQIIAASLSPSKGKINHLLEGKAIDAEDVYTHIGLATPYMELVEEFSLSELIDFHFSVKVPYEGIDRSFVIDLLGMQSSRDKLIRNFSSGMKQRVKLALSCCSQSACLLLDEPTANLDNQGVDWYLKLLERFTSNRMLIICSNQLHEYDFCETRLNILDYK